MLAFHGLFRRGFLSCVARCFGPGKGCGEVVAFEQSGAFALAGAAHFAVVADHEKSVRLECFFYIAADSGISALVIRPTKDHAHAGPVELAGGHVARGAIEESQDLRALPARELAKHGQHLQSRQVIHRGAAVRLEHVKQVVAINKVHACSVLPVGAPRNARRRLVERTLHDRKVIHGKEGAKKCEAR